jgi:hypothetical protein
MENQGLTKWAVLFELRSALGLREVGLGVGRVLLGEIAMAGRIACVRGIRAA